MPELSLQNSKHKVLLDQADWEKHSKYSWRLRHRNWSVQRISAQGKKKIYINLAREILHARPGQMVATIKDRLDFRRQNLRLVTHAQQSWKGKRFQGCKRDGKWIVRFQHEGRRWQIGSYKSRAQAESVYEALCKVYRQDAASFPVSNSSND